jgi:hypothetical protein
VGGIVGLLAISTLAPVAMLVGGVTGAAGGVISALAGHQETQNRKRVLAEVNTIVQELEVKVTAVTREIQQLVGCEEEEDNVKVLTNEKRGGLTKYHSIGLPLIETGFAEQFYASHRMGPAPFCLKISARTAKNETYQMIPLSTRLLSH